MSDGSAAIQETDPFDRPFMLLAGCLAAGMSLFHVAAFFMVLPAMGLRGWHVGLGVALIVLTIPLTRPRRWWSAAVDLGLAGAALTVAYYGYANYIDLARRAGMPTTTDIVVAVTLTILVLEIARRMAGWFLTGLGIAALLYGLYGNLLPGQFAHRGFSLERLVGHLFMSGEGIYGMPIGVSATIVFLFILFGAVLQLTGGGKFFIDLAMALFGTVRGGIAKVSVLASALFGTISGTGTGNAVASGSITIPMMIARGYQPRVAAAIECAASTGGPLLPPMMAAGAFLIPEFIGTSYRTVIIAATIPAMLYFWSLFWTIDFHAARIGDRAMPRSECPKLGKVLKDGGHFLLVIGLIIYMLLVMRVTPSLAAISGIGAAAVLSFVRPMPGYNRSPRMYFDILRMAAMNARIVIAATAVAGIVMGIITLTGVGLAFSSRIITLAGGSQVALMVIAMAGSIVLGMGIPPVAAYVIVAILVAPSLINAGIEPLAAHLFVFWYGIMALISPPIASAVFATCGISGSRPIPTAIEAMKFSAVGFVIPMLFAVRPAFLMHGSAVEIATVVVSFCLGSVAVAAGIQGYLIGILTPVQRVLFLVAGGLCIFPSLTTDIVGVLLLGAMATLSPIIRRPGWRFIRGDK